ncbi:MAG: hypothetical protein PF961_07585 [Planctomycetota bacterium]|nr:hypothetical protein [Planctomycetota bacterium]
MKRVGGDLSDDAVESLVRLVDELPGGNSDYAVAGDLVLVLSNDNWGKLVHSRVFESLDVLRGSDGKLPAGILNKPAGAGSSGLLLNLRRGNLGHAFEPVGTANMVKSGVFSADQITEMGRKFRARTPGRRTVEADVWIQVDGHFIDLKASNGSIERPAARDLALQIIEGGSTGVRRGSYAVQSPGLSSSKKRIIDAANELIGDYNEITGEKLPLIDVIDAGTF